MKKVLISAAGSPFFKDVDEPRLDHPDAVLVRTRFSAVSPGTERRILRRLAEEGAGGGEHEIGYASSGLVREVGENITHVRPGDPVACYGTQWAFAGHGGASAPRRHSFAKVPEGVGLEEAAFAAIGTFPLNALRLTKCGLGETVVVIGLGLLGLITVQLARAAGLVVVGVEPHEGRRKLAERLGAEAAFAPGDEGAAAAVGDFTEGAGADACVLATAGESPGPLEEAMGLSRERGRVVFLGGGGRQFTRTGPFREKELELVAVKASGPGRYDGRYERDCVDYPLPYARWTVHRNLKEVLRQMGEGALRVKPLIERRVPFDRAAAEFERLAAGEPVLGIVFEYEES